MLAAPHRGRRQVDLAVRHIQTTLGMERLRCRTPERARKELWIHLLADDLIRLLMARAVLPADQLPRRLGFKHTVQVRRRRRNNRFPLMTKFGAAAREAVRLNGHAKKQR